MNNTPHSSFLPLPADETIESFRVAGTMAVRALIRELIGARALVTVYAADDTDVFIVTRLLALEADSLELDFEGDAQRLQALLAAPYLTVVGVPGAVKIQFRLKDVEVIPVPGKGGKPAGATLAASVPSEGWRVQRRNAFRVHPPLDDNALVALRLPGNGELKGRLTDISVGGLAISWPPGTAEPELGTRLRHCRIETGGIAPIPCELRVVRVDPAADGQAPIVSCEFEGMPQAVARFVQLYVMDIEKRARAASRKR
jgi:c-di-GMP-binding flagellar brake protein YcgR